MAKPILVVLGPKGTGKSYLINKIFKVERPTSKSATHVTQSQALQEVEHELFRGFLDTVGLDADKNNYVSVGQLYNKPLVILYLNNDIRIMTSLLQIQARLGIKPDQVCVFNSFSFKDLPEDYPSKDMQYEDIFIQLPQIAQKTITLSPPPAPAPPPVPIIYRSVESKIVETKSSSVSKKAAKTLTFASQFPNVRDSSVCARIQKTTVTDKLFKTWVRQLSRQEVSKYREIGDSLLALLLHTLYSKGLVELTEVNEVKTNELLSQFFFYQMGTEADQALQRIYGISSSREFSAESVGNVVEALLGKSYSLGLFDQILGFARANFRI